MLNPALYINLAPTTIGHRKWLLNITKPKLAPNNAVSDAYMAYNTNSHSELKVLPSVLASHAVLGFQGYVGRQETGSQESHLFGYFWRARTLETEHVYAS